MLWIEKNKSFIRILFKKNTIKINLTKNMPDDKNQTGKQDDIRINVHQSYELHDWSRKFGVTPEELKKAVEKVGPMVDKVKKELGK